MSCKALLPRGKEIEAWDFSGLLWESFPCGFSRTGGSATENHGTGVVAQDFYTDGPVHPGDQ